VSAALSTRGLDKSFGSLVVARAIEFSLPQGARHALIGPNGAGKTTLINLMTGMLRPDAARSCSATSRSMHSRPRNALRVGWCARSRSTRCFRISRRSKP
jgi:ABC-type branched-subunit amino acid transport system ATPase component